MPRRGYLIEKNEEAYAKVFTVHYPDEERVAARPLRQTPCYERMKDLGAVFGSVYGWERPNWFAPQGYGLSEADLAKPDVLLNENHPPVGARREAAREMELPPLELFRIRRRRVPQRARERRPAGHVGLRQVRGLGARRGGWLELDPDQQRPEDDRPRHADLSSHRARRRARGIHADPHRAGAVLSRLGRRARDA